MDQEIIIDQENEDQPIIEDLGYMGSVTGNQAMSAFPGKGLMQVDQAVSGQTGSMGYVTINGERVPYEELQDVPGGVGKIMKRKTY